MMTFPCAHPAKLSVQARHIFLPCREQQVVSLSTTRLSPAYPSEGRGAQQAAQHAADLWTSALGISWNAQLYQMLKLFSACALCPFSPWLGLGEIQLLM